MPIYAIRINGRTHQIEGDRDDSLLSVLRYELDLTGSKFGCGEGACGACTVLVDNQAARSCVTRLAALAGKSVTTIEGLGGEGDCIPSSRRFSTPKRFSAATAHREW